MSSVAIKGLKAIQDRRYDVAIDELTAALKSQPAPRWYLERSKAHLRTSRFDNALYDAEMALRIAYDRANRDLMAEAQLRRAITLFRMGRYADADICAFWAMQLVAGAPANANDGRLTKVDHNGDYVEDLDAIQEAEKAKCKDELSETMQGERSIKIATYNQAFTWRIQALTKMQALSPGSDGRRIQIAAKYPTPESPEHAAQNGSLNHKSEAAKPVVTTGQSGEHDEAWEQTWKRWSDLDAKNKIRCSFYQTDKAITIDIFIKNVPKDLLVVETGARTITLRPKEGHSISGIHGTVKLFLYDKIKHEMVCDVKSMKIALGLQKETPGKWPTFRHGGTDLLDGLYYDSRPAPIGREPFVDYVKAMGYKDVSDLKLPDFNEDPDAWYTSLTESLKAKLEPILEQDTGMQLDKSPAPVTSGNTAPSEAQPMPQSAADQNESAPSYPTSSKKGPINWDNIDDGEDDNDDANDPNALFRRLYQGADEKSRMAMKKSMQESNGTVLTTNWDEAKSKTYETLPPDGAEAKRYE
ncbi:SGS-domain-containing protein [Xylariaceae sp. FL1019]|nr:SGS-domain-containing protein [Xylariaceae sp. FL1019]